MVKPLEGSNQTATQVKVSGPEINSMKRPKALFRWKATRRASPRHDVLFTSGVSPLVTAFIFTIVLILLGFLSAYLSGLAVTGRGAVPEPVDCTGSRSIPKDEGEPSC
ncbi:MAG: hypothetical protein ACLQMF_18595 [Rectinemataceae bacterium]